MNLLNLSHTFFIDVCFSLYQLLPELLLIFHNFFYYLFKHWKCRFITNFFLDYSSFNKCFNNLYNNNTLKLFSFIYYYFLFLLFRCSLKKHQHTAFKDTKIHWIEFHIENKTVRHERIGLSPTCEWFWLAKPKCYRAVLLPLTGNSPQKECSLLRSQCISLWEILAEKIRNSRCANWNFTLYWQQQ